MNFLENDMTKSIVELLLQENIFLVADNNVAKLYPEFTTRNKFLLNAKEEIKSLEIVSLITKKMLDSGVNRQTRLVVIGGGLTCDVAGFAASVYMRGIDWVCVPTTLLAMVDASIGGKTGVNFERCKNMIGTFYPPQEILVSLHFLRSLNKRERMSGIGEVIKTAFLDEDLFKFIEMNFKKLFEFDEEVMQEVVKRCIGIKKEIVLIDPFEKDGARKILNIGHTIGHALETVGSFSLSHGEYVLFGMLIEGTIIKKYFTLEKYLPKINFLKKVLKGRKIKFNSDDIVKVCLKDKKNEKGKISIVAGFEWETKREYFFSEKEFLASLESSKKEIAEFICL